jgi:hypothetical protein
MGGQQVLIVQSAWVRKRRPTGRAGRSPAAARLLAWLRAFGTVHLIGMSASGVGPLPLSHCVAGSSALALPSDAWRSV